MIPGTPKDMGPPSGKLPMGLFMRMVWDSYGNGPGIFVDVLYFMPPEKHHAAGPSCQLLKTLW